MCGILGVSFREPIQDRSWLAIARDLMVHRGPDDLGEWWSVDGRVGLAHRRLSIVDLSLSGHQPMHLYQRGLSIVFNGEIYNHHELRNELISLGYSFSSSSDTEVLLVAYSAWGEECLTHLNGMFAFALYDNQQHRLFLARDRAGEKPLFYRLENGNLQFSSELKALLANPANPRCIDTEALDCYLAIGYVPGERCLLAGFKKLQPANALIFDLRTRQAKIWRYWSAPEFASEHEHQDEIALLEELECLLENSVRRQMVAEVPVGVLLSGGLDSSLVTAIAVRASRQVNTFTIGFPGHGNLDETEHARLISRHFDTHHTELIAEDASADLLPRLARQFDEPIVDSSIIPTFLVSQLVRHQAKVALGGDGGDELFGGYGYYSSLQLLKKRLGFVPMPLRRGIALSAEKLLPVGLKGRNWAQGLGVNLNHGPPQNVFCFDATTRARLMAKQPSWRLVAETVLKGLAPTHTNLVQRATRMDFSNYLPEDILVKVDRASMLNSLEMRSPFLDFNLIEFAFGKVPSYLKATASEKKILLKRLAERILPPEFDQHRKQGFSIPLGEWLKGGAFRKLFNEVLRDPQCSFESGTVDILLRGQDRGYKNSERLFALVLFELWRREYAVTF